MKKLLAILLLTSSSLSFAGPHHGGHHGFHHHRGYDFPWVPFVTGAVTGAVIYDIYNRPVVVQQPPVIVQQPSVVVQQQNCSIWTETQHPDGTITRTRTCSN